MEKLNLIDLEFLFLGMQNNGTFNESDVDNSSLKNLGVGKVLDSLASLKERCLLEMNKDGSFKISNSAKQLLWNDEIPLWIKILRILEIEPFELKDIAKYLRFPEEVVLAELDLMRKNNLVLMSPLRQESKLIKMYELLPEGKDELQKIESKDYQNAQLVMKNKQDVEIFELLDDIMNKIKNDDTVTDETKRIIENKISQIKNKLKI